MVGVAQRQHLVGIDDVVFEKGDEQCGEWSRVKLERMDFRFCSAVERAFKTGRESELAAWRNGSPKR